MIPIVRMVECHHARVLDILSACYHWLGIQEGWSIEQIEWMISDRASMEIISQESKVQDWVVALRDGLVVGLAAVKGNGLAKLYLDPAYHRQGIGTKLFRAAEQMIREAHHREMTLGSTDTSVPFYKAMGMYVVRRQPSKAEVFSGREVVIMKKDFSISQ